METARALTRIAISEGRLDSARELMAEYPPREEDSLITGLCLTSCCDESSLDLLSELPKISPVHAHCAAFTGGHLSAINWVQKNLPLVVTPSTEETISIYLAATRSNTLDHLPTNLPPPPVGTLYYAFTVLPLQEGGEENTKTHPLANQVLPTVHQESLRQLVRLSGESSDHDRSIATLATADGEWKKGVDRVLELCGPVTDPDAVCALIWSSGYPDRAEELASQLGAKLDWTKIKLSQVEEASPIPPAEVAVHVFPQVDSVDRLRHLFTTQPNVDWGEHVHVRLANTLYIEDDEVYQFLHSRWPEHQTTVRDSPSHLEQALLGLCHTHPVSSVTKFRQTFPHIPLTEQCVIAAARGDNLEMIQYLLDTLEEGLAEEDRSVWTRWGGKIERA